MRVFVEGSAEEQAAKNARGGRTFISLPASVLAVLPRRPRRPYLPWPVRVAIGLTLGVWLFAHLPIALRRVYGGSRVMTGVKLATLGVLYVLALVAVVPVIVGVALLQF